MRRYEIVGSRTAKFGVTVMKLWFSEDVILKFVYKGYSRSPYFMCHIAS
jgi:hypothetical protein